MSLYIKCVINVNIAKIRVCYPVRDSMIQYGLKMEAGQFDIETAFLYGDLEEKLWMDFPDGYVDYI
jgi:hypothetical protein